MDLVVGQGPRRTFGLIMNMEDERGMRVCKVCTDDGKQVIGVVILTLAALAVIGGVALYALVKLIPLWRS